MGAPYHNQDKQQTYLILPRLQHYRDRDAFTKVRKIDQAMNDEALLLKLDVLEEEREKAVIEEAKKQSKDGTVLQRQGPKWEGPYEVVKALKKEHTSSETEIETYFREHGMSRT
ncbi:hypothetical protein Tco_0413263 [Tanacetum coccineum]